MYLYDGYLRLKEQKISFLFLIFVCKRSHGTHQLSLQQMFPFCKKKRSRYIFALIFMILFSISQNVILVLSAFRQFNGTCRMFCTEHIVMDHQIQHRMSSNIFVIDKYCSLHDIMHDVRKHNSASATGDCNHQVPLLGDTFRSLTLFQF